MAIKKAKVFADDDEEFFMELSQEAAIMRYINRSFFCLVVLWHCYLFSFT